MLPITGTPIYNATKSKDLRDLMMGACDKYKESDAFIFRRSPQTSEIHRTFYEFGEDIKNFGTYLISQNLGDSPIGVVGENCYEWFVAYNAILESGHMAVPLDRALPEDELIQLLKRSRTKILIYHHKHHAMMVSIAGKAKEDKEIKVEKFVVMHKPSLATKKTTVEDVWPDDDRFIDFYDWVSAGENLRIGGDDSFMTTPIDPKEPKIILFTSGTTSMSKGVLLTHDNIVSNVYGIARTLDVHKGDRAFSILPLHHTFENTCDFFILSVGGCLCLCDGLRYLIKNYEEWKPDVCISVPLLYENIYSKIEDGIKAQGKDKTVEAAKAVTKFLKHFGLDLRRNAFKSVLDKLGGNLRLVVIGGAGIDAKYIDAFTDFGIDFFMGYGLTETSPVIAVTNELCNVHGSVGRPLPGVEVKIDLDESQTKTRGPKAVGEILTKSDCVMKGYFENDEATKEVFTEDGWFRTGDMGYIDKKGCIHITGRVKSMIVLTSGKKAFPEEIEAVLTEIPGVTEAFVWGNKNDRQAIDICAKLLINRKAIGEALGLKVKPDDAAVEAYLNDAMAEANHKMPAYKYVHYHVFSEEDMIKTTTLKIKRPKEQEAIENKLKECNTAMRDISGKNFDLLA